MGLSLEGLGNRTGKLQLCEGLLHFLGERFHEEFRRVPTRQNCVPRRRNLFHITQISVRSIHIVDELDVNLLDENQYRSRFLAGTLVGRSLLILGESRSTVKIAGASHLLEAHAYLFLCEICEFCNVSDFN